MNTLLVIFGDINDWAFSGLSDFVPPVIYDALAEIYMLHLAIGDFKQNNQSMTCG